MAPPWARAASSARLQQLDLAGLGHVAREDLDHVGRPARCWRTSSTVRAPPPPPRAAAAAASAAADRPASVRSAVWAKPVVSPTTTRMPAPRSRPEVSSSTLPSSSRADDDRLSSTKISAKSPPVSQGGAEHPADDGLFDHGWASCGAVTGSDGRSGGSAPARGRARCALAAPARSAYRNPVPVKPGLSAAVELVVSDADTAVAMRSGSVPVLATPRLIALCEEASVAALEGHLAPGETSVGTKVQIDHLAATGRGPDGAGRGQRREGQRAADHLHGVGQRRPGAGGGRPRRPGWWSTSSGSSTRLADRIRPRVEASTGTTPPRRAADGPSRTRSIQPGSGPSSGPVTSASAAASARPRARRRDRARRPAGGRRPATPGGVPDSRFDRWGWLMPACPARADIDRPDRSRMTRRACRLSQHPLS